MKSIKGQLVSVVIVVVTINIIASIGSVVIQRQVISEISGTESIVYYQPDSENSEIKAEDQIDNEHTEISTEKQVVECNEDSCIVSMTSQFQLVIALPYLFYMTLSLLSLGYGIFKVNKILKQINQFKDSTTESLETATPNQTNYQFIELTEVNNVLNKSIIAANDSKRLEKEVVTFAMHDIKTPLQIIQGLIDLLKLDFQDQKQLSAIELQINRINKIVESGLNPTILSNCDIGFLIEQLITEYALVYKQIEFQFIDNNQHQWLINPQSFRRILTNIIDNAIKNVDQRRTIKVIVENDQILIENTTAIITNYSFQQLVTISDGLGLQIVSEYSEMHNLQPQVEVENGWFKFILSKNIHSHTSDKT